MSSPVPPVSPDDEREARAASPLPPEAHVLVVEDDGEMRTLIAKFLRQNGFRVTGARNGAEMWDTISLAPVDLVLLDVMLPDGSGLELLKQLRGEHQKF